MITASTLNCLYVWLKQWLNQLVTRHLRTVLSYVPIHLHWTYDSEVLGWRTIHHHYNTNLPKIKIAIICLTPEWSSAGLQASILSTSGLSIEEVSILATSFDCNGCDCRGGVLINNKSSLHNKHNTNIFKLLSFHAWPNLMHTEIACRISEATYIIHELTVTLLDEWISRIYWTQK